MLSLFVALKCLMRMRNPRSRLPHLKRSSSIHCCSRSVLPRVRTEVAIVANLPQAEASLYLCGLHSTAQHTFQTNCATAYSRPTPWRKAPSSARITQSCALLAPPVKGTNWLADDAPSNDPDNHHRRGIIVFDGRAQISRRY